jgi:hypothetical protein
MEDPSSTFRFMSYAQEQSKFDELSASDTLLLGRVTDEIDATLTPPGKQCGATGATGAEKLLTNAGFATACISALP